jgi:ferric-dicitrate binding protein FerR (iron transport regulator)
LRLWRPGPRGEVVELRAGRVWCEVDRGRGAFEVRTDGATARVLGTSFVVEREEQGDTEVRVMGGTVEVEDHRKGGRVLVTAGQKSRVHAGAPPSAVDRYREEDDRDAWNDLLRELGRKLRRVGKLLDRLLEK